MHDNKSSNNFLHYKHWTFLILFLKICEVSTSFYTLVKLLSSSHFKYNPSVDSFFDLPALRRVLRLTITIIPCIFMTIIIVLTTCNSTFLMLDSLILVKWEGDASVTKFTAPNLLILFYILSKDNITAIHPSTKKRYNIVQREASWSYLWLSSHQIGMSRCGGMTKFFHFLQSISQMHEYFPTYPCVQQGGAVQTSVISFLFSLFGGFFCYFSPEIKNTTELINIFNTLILIPKPEVLPDI